MSKIVGKISTFGGPEDSGMTPQEGLSMWTHAEADERPDLFYTQSYDKTIGVSKRLKPSGFYFAYRFCLDPRPDRKTLQSTQFLFRNPLNGKMVVACLTDWGPHERTERVFDVSPGVAAALEISTDQEIEGVNVSEVSSLFV